MTGTTDLATLLAAMDPALSDAELVFCSFANAGIAECLSLSPVGCFIEQEGLSLIIGKSIAEQNGIAFETTFRGITLQVHSSLQAVGLTAAVAGRLALHGISANVVAAYHHDHIFVPTHDAERALLILRTLQTEAAATRGDA
jgi:hypothetical protein